MRPIASFLCPTPSSAETSGDPEFDRLPFGLSFRSSVTIQGAPIPASGWFGRGLRLHLTASALAEQLRAQVNRLFADQVTPVRLASHLSVLGVAALILLLTQVNIPDWDFSLRLLPNSGLLGNSAISGGMATPVTAFASQANGAIITGEESLERATIPFTIIRQEPVAQIQAYTVQAGDTVLAIANKFGLNPETIQWSNSGLEFNADLIRPGDQLQILPFDGAIHIVAPGDTLSSLADDYSVAITDIVNYPGNGLADAAAPLSVGQQLVVPGGVKSAAAQQVFGYAGGGNVPSTAKLGSGNFGWPTSGSINQQFWSGHPGVDIGAWTGAPVEAADGGYVVVATGGWNGGYGNHVIIDHGNGFVTLYAHLNSIYVRAGENVARGTQVGSVGNTGNSTGSHLHFEIRYQGSPRNPLSYLP